MMVNLFKFQSVFSDTLFVFFMLESNSPIIKYEAVSKPKGDGSAKSERFKNAKIDVIFTRFCYLL